MTTRLTAALAVLLALAGCTRHLHPTLDEIVRLPPNVSASYSDGLDGIPADDSLATWPRGQPCIDPMCSH